jgi:hypothetical protein
MLLLIASALALLVGPLLVRLSGRRPAPIAFLDGMVLAALLGLVLLTVIPHAIEHGGGWAAVAAVVGLVLPGLLERRLGDMHDVAHGAMLWGAMIGLAIHAMLDGAVLLSTGNLQLALGVVLHRIPIGLTIWWAVRPNRGVRAAFAIMAFIALATAVGFVGAEPLLAKVPLGLLGTFEALVAGSLLHVVLGHQPPALEAIVRRHRVAATLGVGVGALSIIPLLDLHGHDGASASGGESAFLMLALESAPALLLAFAGAGLLRGLMTPGSVRWLRGGSAFGQAAKGMVFGLPLPICSCGVLPVYRSLVISGVPAAGAMAFLIATPEIGVDAILITIPLLGVELAVIRLVAAAIVALTIGWLIGARIAPRSADQQAAAESAQPDERPLGARLASGLRFGFGELVDHIGPWILAGLAVAAMVEPLMSSAWLAELPRGLDVPVATLIGLPGYVCASGATPLAAVLMHKGLSAGAAIAFLLTGPATNVTTFAVLSALHGRRVAVTFAAAVATLSIAIGYGVNAWLAPVAQLPLDLATPSHSWLEYGSLALLAVVFLASLLRQGPRGVLGQIFDPHAAGAGDDHDHDHDHPPEERNSDHGHAHSGPDHGPDGATIRDELSL